MKKALFIIVVAIVLLSPIALVAQDSIVVVPGISDEALAVFGIPVGWLLTTIPLVIGWVAAVKQLFSNWLNSAWLPALNAVLSFTYAYFTLRPSWLAVAIGALALFLTTWTSWAGAKTVAVKVGARDK